MGDSNGDKSIGTVVAIATGDGFSAVITKRVEAGKQTTTFHVIESTDYSTDGSGNQTAAGASTTTKTEEDEWKAKLAELGLSLEMTPAQANAQGFRKLVVKADPVVLDGVSVVTTTTSFISSATVTLRDQAESKKNSDAPTVMTQAEWNVVEQAAIKAQADEAAGGAKSPYGKTETVTTTRSEAGAQVTATVTIYTYTNGADTTVYTRTVETAPAWELVMVEGDTETDYYELYTFGNNASGQLAQGNNKVVSAPYHYPTLVDMGTDDDGDALASVIMVNAAEDHMITIKKDGYMWSSGRNSYGQLGNVNTSNSNTMVMVGQQFVDARPSPINMVKGQTLNISELITNKDKPLTVTYQAGINLLLRGSSQRTVAEVWTASTTNESILSVRKGGSADPDDDTLKKAIGRESFNHPNFNVTKAAAAELPGTPYRNRLDARIAALEAALGTHNAANPTAQISANEEMLYLWAKLGLDARHYTTAMPADIANTGYILSDGSVSTLGVGEKDNPYVTTFIGANSGLLKGTGAVNGDGDPILYVYNGTQLEPLGPQVAIFDKDYYITGNSLGQTTIRVRVPGLSASAWVVVNVMDDPNSKTNPMVAVGETHTLALKSDGTVWSWGDNSHGELGRDSYESMDMVIFPNMVEYAIENRDPGNLNTNYFDRAGIRKPDGSPILTYEDWVEAGSDTGFLNESGYPWDDPDPIVYIVAGAHTSYAMSESGKLFAWGKNDRHQLGVYLDAEGEDYGHTGTDVTLPHYVYYPVTTGDETPTVESLRKVESVGTMDVKSKWDAQPPGMYRDTLYFTVNTAGGEQLLFATGEGFASSIPTKLSTEGMSTIIQISADYALAGGEVWHLSATEPEKVTGFTAEAGEEATEAPITRIAVGAEHLLALDDKGGMWAVGSNAYGQLGRQTGDGDELGDSERPIRVQAGEQGEGYLGNNTLTTTENARITNIAAGQFSSYARAEDGTIWAWGDNSHGQLGLPAPTVGTVPAKVGAPKKVDTSNRGDHYFNIFAGFSQSVNLDETGMLWADGANEFDQLANGTTADTYQPTLVGDSALQVSIANNYSFEEDDKELHLGDYIYVGYDGSSPKGLGRYEKVTTEEELAEHPSGFYRKDGRKEDLTYYAPYYFDPNAKSKVAPDNLSLVAGHNYYLETDFSVFCLFTSNDVSNFEYIYRLAYNNNDQVQTASGVERSGASALVLKETSRAMEYTLYIKDANVTAENMKDHGSLLVGYRPINSNNYTVTDDKGNEQPGRNGWFVGIKGQMTFLFNGVLTDDYVIVCRQNNSYEVNESINATYRTVTLADFLAEGGQITEVTENVVGEDGTSTEVVTKISIHNPLSAYQFALQYKDLPEGSELVETYVTVRDLLGASQTNHNGWFTGNNSQLDFYLNPGAQSDDLGKYNIVIRYAKELVHLRTNADLLGKPALDTLWVQETQISQKSRYVPITILPADGPEANKVVWETNKTTGKEERQFEDDGETVKTAPKDSKWSLSGTGSSATKTLADYYFKENSSLVPAKVSTGYGHTLALRADNTIWAYGLNQYGQLGVGPEPHDNGQSESIQGWDDPVEIQTWVWNSSKGAYEREYITQVSEDGTDRYRSKVNFVDVSAGYTHSLAVDSEGNIWAAGDNSHGQLGITTDSNGDAIKQRTFFIKTVDVTAAPMKNKLNGARFVAVSAGKNYSMALASDGTVWAWGDNSMGQLGLRSNAAQVNTPTKLTLINVNAVSAGKDHTLFAMFDGTVYATGSNAYGKLGVDTESVPVGSYSTAPVFVNGLASIVDVSAGEDHSLVLSRAARVYTWGYAADGRLGRELAEGETYAAQPGLISSLTYIVAVDAGRDHNLALEYNGDLYSWGGNATASWAWALPPPIPR